MSSSRAVVLGASMGGLLAARVLSEFFDTVTVVERDILPATVAQRRGVPQGRHVHGLLAAGALAFEELFPGFLRDLTADGATVLDKDAQSRISMSFAGHKLGLGEQPAKPMVTYLCTRPFLEAHVRDRVRELDNVEILDGHDAVEMLLTKDRVSGVRIADHHSGDERSLDADLVVDATGRSCRTGAFLERHGYPRPTEDRIDIQVAYASQLLQLPADAFPERLVFAGLTPERPYGGSVFVCENNSCMVTVGGMAGFEPPTDHDGMLDFAADTLPARIMTALLAAEPLGPVATYRYPASIRRHYERVPRFPSGLLVFGDAICSFNPIYGQGMSVAALEAIALRKCLVAGRKDLGVRFLRAAAKVIDPAWQLASGADLAMPQVNADRPVSVRIANWYTEHLLTAAETDPVVAEAFLRVTNLVDPLSRFLHPSIVTRVAMAGRRRVARVTPARATAHT